MQVIKRMIYAGAVATLLLFAFGITAAQTQVTSWTNVVGVSVSGNNLTKTASEGWGNAGASSVQSLASGDGYVESTVSEINTNRMFGLSKGDSHQSYTDIDFAFYPAIGALNIYESGIFRGTFGAYATGDVLRVGVEGGVVKYRKNSALIYTSTVTPAYPLLVDTTFYSTNATINNVIVSWATQPSSPYSPMQIFFDANNNTGFGTTSPIFNDDGVTGENVGKYFAIDAGIPEASAYLGIGGFRTNVTAQVGRLNFYNRAMGGVDNRTAVIYSNNAGQLGRGDLVFGTSPDNVGPIARMKIDWDGSVRIGNINIAGGTVGVTALSGKPLVQTWYDTAGQPLVTVTADGRVSFYKVSKGVVLRSPNNSCFEIMVSNTGALSTVPVVPCP